MIKPWLKQLFASLDGWLLGLLAFTLTVSLLVLFSAAGENMDRVTSQFTNMMIACGVMWLFAITPPRFLQQLAVPMYLLGVMLLVGVALFGDISKGAQRWLDLGVIRIQPSEIMKIATPMMLAWYFARRETALRPADHLVGALLLAVPVGLIMEQPDLGTSIMIGASGFYVLFLAGLSWRLMLGVAASLAAAAPILWSLLHDYQRRRIEILFDPYQDPLGSGYHTIQSSIALGSGGLAGKGWMNGTQSQLDFLPERHTDFIFAVFGEEFGLVGGVLLLTLFATLIGRGAWIAYHASTTFGRLLAGSITLTLFTYVFVNMGMVMGILPVVGVPLPLISYGGTSMVTLMIGFGILMSIQTHKQLVSS